MYCSVARAACTLFVSLVLFAVPSDAQVVSPDAPLDEPPRRPEEVEAGRTVTDEQNRYDRFIERFKSPYFSLDVLLQGVGTFVLDDADAPRVFQIGNARIKVYGTIDQGFGYLLQAGFDDAPALVDAQVSYAPSRHFKVVAGRYRVPFSYERLTSAASTDFVNRSRIVQAIAPGRGVGVGFEASALKNALELRAGAFNAIYDRDRAGDTVERDPGDLLFAGRLAYRSERARLSQTDGPRFVVGVNAGYESADESPSMDIPARATIPARLIAGADARVIVGPILLSAERLVEFVDTNGLERTNDGYHFTLGFDVNANHRILARADGLELVDVGTTAGQFVFGYNVTLTRAASLQADLILPLDGTTGANRLLVNAQISL